ncbi:MAG: ankyrin repeat domain-containing protein [Thermoleophilia bacterium]|nr:ankyrin repeat domain-containing protein [Thermoleophilia bacterium]
MTDETYENQRKHALMRRSADLGLRRQPGRPVWGVVMETGEKNGVTTVVATDDGALSLLTSADGSVHLNKDQWPSSAGTRLVGAAGDFLFESSPAWAYPLPENGMVRFYLLTFDGVVTTEAPTRELADGERPLSDLYYAGHDVLFLAQLVSKEPNWMSHKPAVRPAPVAAAAPVGAPADAPPEAVTPPAEPPRVETPPAEANGSALLMRAAGKNDVDEVARLLAEGHGYGPCDNGITPLMAAAHAGALEPLRLLLAAGAPVDTQESHGYTALMLACNAGHAVCVRLLLGAGADLHAADDEGLTSLMFAAKNGHNDVVRILLERGADPIALNERGLSAVILAKQKGHTETVAILLSK